MRWFFFALVLVACGKEVDPLALPYLQKFREEGAARGMALDTNLSVFVDKSFVKAGRCETSLLGNKIRIGGTTPLDATYRDSVELVIFHELGHCILNKPHIGEPGIMNPTTDVAAYPFHRKEWLDTFFEK